MGKLRYKVRYKQYYMETVLEDEYVTYADSEAHMEEKIAMLWRDDHVFEVDYERVDV